MFSITFTLIPRCALLSVWNRFLTTRRFYIVSNTSSRLFSSTILGTCSLSVADMLSINEHVSTSYACHMNHSPAPTWNTLLTLFAVLPVPLCVKSFRGPSSHRPTNCWPSTTRNSKAALLPPLQPAARPRPSGSGAFVVGAATATLVERPPRSSRPVRRLFRLRWTGSRGSCRRLDVRRGSRSRCSSGSTDCSRACRPTGRWWLRSWRTHTSPSRPTRGPTAAQAGPVAACRRRTPGLGTLHRAMHCRQLYSYWTIISIESTSVDEVFFQSNYKEAMNGKNWNRCVMCFTS